MPSAQMRRSREMLAFEQTSHGRRWTFDARDLAEMRRAANARAARQVLEGGAREPEAERPLSPGEELQLLRKLAWHDLPDLCVPDPERPTLPHVPERVRMLALLYCLRVYAVRSMMEDSGGGVLDPRVLACTALLLAAKVEEHKELDAALLEGRAHVSRQLILALEPDVLAALGHDLCAHSPLLPLDGLLHALAAEAPAAAPPPPAPRVQVKSEGGEPAAAPPEPALAGLRAACVAFLLGPALRADGFLRFSPQQLALAALATCAHTPEGAALGAGAFLAARLPGLLGGAAEFAPVRALMHEAAALPEVDEPREAAHADGLYHRLKRCHQRGKAARAASAATASAGAKRKLEEGSEAAELAREGAGGRPGGAPDAAPLAKVPRS